MGMSDDWFEQEFATTQVMVILRGLDAEASLALAERAWAAGVTMLEIPIQNPMAVAALNLVVAAGRDRGLPVGAGTVLTVEQVEQARRAGAAYTVSPGVDEDVILASLDAGLPTLAGVGTASEIQRCRKLGLGWVKAFPAAVLGPGWFKAMHGPFPGVRFVATGGVTTANAPGLLAGGARVVALGSALADLDQLDDVARLVPRAGEHIHSGA
jgi:2-dehydro-3-deoxyphosphogluconate aldolase / (4S)-4-hydroxy-2-oxoglutarate aldolase